MSRTSESIVAFHTLSDQIKALEQGLNDINALKTHVLNYIKTRDVYAEYRKSGYSKRFAAEHQQEIELHKAAKLAFDQLGIKKLPKVRDLQSQYGAELHKKKVLYADYRKVKEEMRTLQTAKANIERIVQIDNEGKRNDRESSYSR